MKPWRSRTPTDEPFDEIGSQPLMMGSLTAGDAIGGATLSKMPADEADQVTYEFLSAQWLAAVHELRQEHPDAGAGLPIELTMNLVVTEVPSGEDVLAHVDTSNGPLVVAIGHLEVVDLHVVVDFATARSLLVDGDTQAAMGAFLAGKIRVDGDLTKLLAVQSASPDDDAMAFANAMRDLTA